MSLLDGLVSYWKLDEASGTREDAHGSNDLTDNNTVGVDDGILNDGADFERANAEYLSIADASQVGLDLSGDFSVSFWTKLESWDGFTGFFSKWSTGDTQRAYRLINGGEGLLQLNVSSNGANPPGLIETWSPSTGVWYHVVVTYDLSAGTATFYIDGVQLGSPQTGGATSIHNSSAAFILGRQTTTNDNYMDGLIDEFGIWSRVLDASEVVELYNSGAGLAYESFAGGTEYTLTCDVTAYTVTAQSAGLEAAYELAADAAAYSVTLQDATLAVAQNLALETASYVVTGYDMVFDEGASLLLEVASYTVTANEADLPAVLSMALDAASFDITTYDAELTPAYSLAIESASFTVTGEDAALQYVQTLSLETESFDMTFEDAELTSLLAMAIEPAAFLVTAQDAQIRRDGWETVQKANGALSWQAPPSSHTPNGTSWSTTDKTM